MKTTNFLNISVMWAVVTAAAQASLPLGWDEPSGGYQVIYDAADGVWPHGTSPYWDIDPFRGDHYTGETSYVRIDDLTGEPALYMSEADFDGWPSYSLAHSGGDGTPTDKMTIDFRFRLLRPEGLAADARNHSSFRVNVWRPAADWASSVRFAVTFSETEISYVNGATAPYAFGTDWHDVRITIDVAESIFRLYVDGGTTPVFVESGTQNQAAERNWILFGQQGPGVYGDVHLAYFKWTNQDIAIEPEAPVGVPAVEIRPATVLELPTEEGRHYVVTRTDEAGEIRWEHDNFVGDGGTWREIVSLSAADKFTAAAIGDAEWGEPDGGYIVSYSATEGIVPYYSFPAWGTGPFAAYPETHAYLVTDELTDELVLHMNGVDAGAASPTFTLTDSGGAGSSADRMTIDFRFRLVGDIEGSAAQFRVGVWRPDSAASGSIRYMLDFLQDEVGFTGGPSIAYPVGTDWHEARMTIDLVEKVGRLYMNGSSAPLLEFAGGTTGQAASRNLVMFGHAAAAATGEARLSYIRFTNDDAAYPEASWVPVDLERYDRAIELIGHLNPGEWHRWESSGELNEWATDSRFWGKFSPVVRLIDTSALDARRFFRLVKENEE